jgi:hypothetical protein
LQYKLSTSSRKSCAAQRLWACLEVSEQADGVQARDVCTGGGRRKGRGGGLEVGILGTWGSRDLGKMRSRIVSTLPGLKAGWL